MRVIKINSKNDSQTSKLPRVNKQTVAFDGVKAGAATCIMHRNLSNDEVSMQHELAG